MLRSILYGLLGVTLFAGAAAAQCTTTIPNTVTNGTTADASKVMADFNWITGCIGGSNLMVETDGRLGSQAVRFQQTTSSYAYLTMMPGGAITESGFRLYNSSDPSNTAWLTMNVIGATATISASNFGAGTAIGTINTSVPVVQFSGIGTTASAANAFLDATNNKSLLRSTSSIRYKRDIRPIDYDEVRKVLDLVPVSFRSKSPADDPNRIFEGLTAEQVAQHLPQFVNYVKGPDGEDIPDGVQYDRIAAVVLLGVVKHQQTEIETLRSCRLWCMIEEAVGLRSAP